MTGRTSVLVVDDDREIATLYESWLADEYDVRTAFDGESAIGEVDQSVDVVFLDRQMPSLSGDEVLAEIDDRDVDCRVVMVTAVDPDFDIVDMQFDAYLTKPVRRADLVETVEEMRSRDRYDEEVQEYFRLASKMATLESRKSTAELQSSDEYALLRERVAEYRRRADQSAADIEDFAPAIQDLLGRS